MSNRLFDLMNMLLKIVLVGVILLTFSCKKEGKITPFSPTFTFNQPVNFPAPYYTFENNPLTKEGFELGRYLFYDPILSLDSSISCSSCHAQSHSFADHNIPFSKGVDKKIGTRNTPALMNLAWSTSFMWNGGVNHIEVQPLVPLTSTHELGESMINIVLKLNRSNFYRTKFKALYEMDEITDQHFLKVLAQFTAMLVSSNSRYDQYISGKINFTTQEVEGYALFKANCASCHREPLFTDYSFRNSGLESIIVDSGRYRVTQNPADLGKFKVPTLRNIEFTYPYMHDGKFMNLEQVIAFKSNGIKDSPTLDPLLKTPFAFTKIQQQALISFLKTLSDYNYTSNPLYAEPRR